MGKKLETGQEHQERGRQGVASYSEPINIIITPQSLRSGCGSRSASRLPACDSLHVRTHPRGNASASVQSCRQKDSLSFQALGEEVDVHSAVYCRRQRRIEGFWRMRASLGLACAQAATLCTKVVGQTLSATSGAHPSLVVCVAALKLLISYPRLCLFAVF